MVQRGLSGHETLAGWSVISPAWIAEHLKNKDDNTGMLTHSTSDIGSSD